MAELGKAWVQIVPSAQGISGSIAEVLEPEADKSGISAGKRITQSLSGTLSKSGKMLSAGITAPLAAVGTASIAAFSEVHTGLENIITKTGASGAALDGMENIMKSIASTVPASFDTIGNSIGEVNTRFGVTGAELEDLSSRFVKFADLNGTDVSASVDAVQTAMAAFGMEASETGNMLDILNKVGQNTGVNVMQLAQSMTTNSAALHQMGFNASQSAQFLGEMEVAGIDSTQMMTGLKRALVNAAKEGKPLDQALSDVQNSIMNASSSTEAMTIASEMFGNKAGPAIAEAVRNGVVNFNDLGAAVEGAAGSVNDTFETTLTPMDKFKLAMNDLKIAGAGVGDSLLTAVVPLVEKLSSGIQKLTTAWNGLSPGMQQFIVKAALIAAAIGPIMAIGGTIMSVIGSLIGSVGTLASVIGFLTSPIGIVVVAIGALIAVGVYLYTHWDTVKAQLAAIWETIKTTATTVWNAIKTAVMTPVNAAKAALQSVWNTIKATASAVWNGIKATASSVWNAIKTAVTTPINAARTAVQSAINLLRTIISSVFNSIKSTATTVWNGIKNAMVKPIESAKATITGIINKIKGMFPISIGKIFSNLKLPHISVSGGSPPFGIGGMGSLPKFSVSWYRGAYDRPYLFNNSTIVPTMSGLKGFGDGHGGEIVYGRRQLMRDIALASNGGGNYTFNIYGAEGQDPKELAEEVRRILVKTENNRRMAWA